MTDGATDGIDLDTHSRFRLQGPWSVFASVFGGSEAVYRQRGVTLRFSAPFIPTLPRTDKDVDLLRVPWPV